MKEYTKNLGKVVMTPKGAWFIEKEYEILDIVYDSITYHAYISKQEVPSGVDLSDSRYWMPLNVSGYSDSNVITLNSFNEDGEIQSYTLEEAIKTISDVGRKSGAILIFYNDNVKRLDITTGCWEIWQFNSINVYEWENLDAWINIYYNYNKFVGWYAAENVLNKEIPNPDVGCYAFVGNIYNEAFVYRCDIKNQWTKTNQKAQHYIKVIFDNNISIGLNGNWWQDGIDTKIPVSVKGDNGLTPYLRWSFNNQIEYSYDNINWYVLSDKFNTNIKIKDYVRSVDELSNNVELGTIYGVGPNYAEDDVEQINPIYALYVYSSNGWVNNGNFNSISAGIINDLISGGETEALSAEMGKHLNTKSKAETLLYCGAILYEDYYAELGYLNELGQVVKNISGMSRGVSGYIDLDMFANNIYIISGIAATALSNMTYACIYDSDKNFIKNLTIIGDESKDIEYLDININDIKQGRYIRFTIADSNNPIKYIALPKFINNNKGINYAYGIQLGYLNNDGSISHNIPGISRGITDFIDVHNYNICKIVFGSAATFLTGGVFAVIYDKNKNYIKSLQYPINDSSKNIYNYYFDISNAYYIKFVSSDITIPVQYETFNAYIDYYTEYGYLLEDGNISPNILSFKRGVTDFINISNFNKGIKILEGGVATRASNYVFAALYDENKNFIKNLKDDSLIDIESHKLINKNIYINEGYYIRFTINDYDYPIVYTDIDDSIYKNFGKSIGVFGGSLSVFKESNFAKLIWKNILDCRICSYGIGGNGFSSEHENNVQKQVDNADVHDIYILWASTNDFTKNKQIGNWSDYTDKDGYNESNLITQCGGINYSIKKLLEKNPNAEIYFFLPVRFFTKDSGYNPYSIETNDLNYTFQDYIQGMKDCCAYYNIPILDQFNFQGVNILNKSLYYKEDNLHLTKNGYEKLGYIQCEFLKNGI